MENNGQVPIIAERDRYRKQLTFDIDTKTLEIYYPKANWRHGYDDIRGFLKREGFRSEERRVGKECRSRWSPYH